MTKDVHDDDQPMLWGSQGSVSDAPHARPKSRTGTTSTATPIVDDIGPLWTINQVAAYLGVPKQTIYGWRTTGYGPRGFRVGKHLRWRPATVREWTADLEEDQ